MPYPDLEHVAEELKYVKVIIADAQKCALEPP